MSLPTYNPGKYDYGPKATGAQMLEVHVGFYEEVEAEDFDKYNNEDPMWDIENFEKKQLDESQCNPSKFHDILCDEPVSYSAVDYELIEITTKPRSAEKIRQSYYRQNTSPVDRVTGSENIRKFYNNKNLRLRKLKEKN